MPSSQEPHLPAQDFPVRPSLAALRKEAKRRLRQLRVCRPDARLYEAQLDVARSYGSRSWRDLHARVLAALADAGRDDAIAAFFNAIGRGTFAAAVAFLEQDPELINQTGPHPFWGGRPQALHLAIERNKAKLFQHFLQVGADPSGDNDAYDGWSPLMLAVHWQRPRMVAALVQAGARCGVIEALMLEDHARVVELVQADPGVLFESIPNDATPLHFCRSVESLRVLLQQGVDPHQTDKYGKTALDAALGAKPPREAVATELQQHMGQSANAGHLAAMGDVLGLQAYLAHHPAGLECTYTVQWHAQTLLQIAAERGHDEVISYLLEQGVEVNETVTEGLTALHGAAWNGHLSSVKLLVAAGADLKAKDERYNATALDYAENNWESLARPGCDQVAAWLQDQ